MEHELTTEEKIDYIYNVAKKLDETINGLAPILGLVGPISATGPNGQDPMNLMKMLG
jgi:hypothetical protein